MIRKVQVTSGNSLSAASTSRKSKAGPIILAMTCGLCAALTLLCCGLITFIIFTSNHVAGDNVVYESNGHLFIKELEQETSVNDVAHRLPNDVIPRHYDIFLYPNLQDGTFSGKVEIAMEVLQTRNSIVLNQKSLNISSVQLNVIDDEADEAISTEVHVNQNLELLILRSRQNITPGKYNLTVKFRGNLRDKYVGFYSSKYRDEENRTRILATSKFEPTYARQAFPCFDEPNFKAEFTVHLVHPTGDCYNALSNMNVESVAVNQPSTGLTTVNFAKSVPMSTYLAAFIVSDFVAVTANAKNLQGKPLPVSVYTTRAQKGKAKFALDVGVKVIEYYMKLYTVNYPLPKMDMVAIPDFASGAMENWGLVTYREARLLYDPKRSSIANKDSIAKVIAHEFAHMWFGNLVTMAWWNDLWLNEGFATYMSYKSLDAIYSDWKIMDNFLVLETHVAMNLDSKISSHPVVQNVTNPDEITAIFDTIAYKKGASIIRMLENFVGTRVFEASITEYLKKFMYKNAETADLFEILQEFAGFHIGVAEVMDTWTRQMGFPVVNVVRKGYSYALTQKRFLIDPEVGYDPSESEYRYKWTIPVSYVTSRNSTPTLLWFHKNSNELLVELNDPVEWIKFNVQGIGYYYVNYDSTNWHAITELLRWSPKRLTAEDRTDLLNGAFSLAEASMLNYSVAMNLTLYLSLEQHNTPWKVAQSKLRKIDSLLLSTNTSMKFREYVRNLVDSTYHDLTWNVDSNEDLVTLRLRTVVISLACSVGHSECLQDAGEIFKSWLHDPKDERPHSDIRSLVYYYGMSHSGNENDWKTMFDKFANETDMTEKLQLMRGLSAIRNSEILRRFIEIAMDENYVRPQDALNCLALISENPIGTPMVWDWVREFWELLVKKYTLNDRYLGNLIPSITQSFATETKLNEMKAFFKKYPQSGAGKTGRIRALETVENNIKWLKRHASKLDTWLEEHLVLN